MTRKEFFERYAERSGTTVERLQDMGMRAFPCGCEYEECDGWQVVSEESARMQLNLGHITPEDYDEGCGRV